MIEILIVDDHPVVLDGTKTLLQDLENVHIETEQESANVLARMESHPFQLYLIDINMKPLNGIQLAEMIKKQQPEALIILYTGYELSDYYELLVEKKSRWTFIEARYKRTGNSNNPSHFAGKFYYQQIFRLCPTALESFQC